MKRPGAGDDELFEDAPPVGLQRRVRLRKAGETKAGGRACIVVLIGWFPLLLLTAIQSSVVHVNEMPSFLRDTGVHARYLIAAPLLVLAEAFCAPYLSAIIRHFPDGGFIPAHDRARFDATVETTRRLLRSNSAEIGVVLLAYIAVAALLLLAPPAPLPAWHGPNGIVPHFSLAGWWHLLVSIPLLLVLIFGWLWRICLWARLLWLIGQFDLTLIAAHPDRCAGLSFVGHSVRAFGIVGTALAAVAAGRSAHLVLAGGIPPASHFYFTSGLLAVIAALFVLPLAAFSPVLLRAWRHGVFEYGALADRMGIAFERKWFGDSKTTERVMLDKPDFSAATDLYSITANVYAIRFIPVDVKDLIALACAMAAPFVPVVLLAIPLKVVVAGIKGLLL